MDYNNVAVILRAEYEMPTVVDSSVSGKKNL